ncbi:MAG: Asp-tRNA(Asn)/Glu-tRNA(Gln) amidotransferase subunit GatB [Candidatus Saccharimonadales bacterium]
MISEEVRRRYTATIGIECHVQLKTASKLFSSVRNDARGSEPNTLISHIDFGLPGSLPVLNEAAIHLACKAAFALGTTPQEYSRFDRKHYFYPDLPKGYQISQFHHPIVLGGEIIVDVDGQPKRIGITRAHLEEDAGKSTHPAGKDYSLVDLNRAGTPLLEIVSEPDMHSSRDAKAYAHELQLRMKYAGVSEADLYYGNMRFDVNVSVSKTSELGTRSETKNLNSFRSIEKAIDYEINRQIYILEKGGKIDQETRGWDDAKQKTFSQRSKEDIQEYRYFPEPDLPPTILDKKYIEKVRAEMPIMPSEWRKRLAKLGLDASQTETLLEAQVETGQVDYLWPLEKSLNDDIFARQLANWFVNIEIPLRRDEAAVLNEFNDDQRLNFYSEVHNLQTENKLSSTKAKALITDVLKLGAHPANIAKYAEDQGYVQVSNVAAINKIVDQVLAENPKAAADVKNGETKAIGFLVGQVMKNSAGQANPKLAQDLVKQKLEIN